MDGSCCRQAGGVQDNDQRSAGDAGHAEQPAAEARRLRAEEHMGHAALRGGALAGRRLHHTVQGRRGPPPLDQTGPSLRVPFSAQHSVHLSSEPCDAVG